MRRKVMFFLIALCSVAVFAQNVEEKRQLIVYVTGPTKENERRALGNEIFHTLVKGGRYAGAERPGDFWDMVIQEQKKQPVSDLQMITFGKQAGADFICVAEITEAFNTFQVSTRIVNLGQGRVDAIGKAYSELKSLEDFTAVSGKILESMFGKQGGK